MDIYERALEFAASGTPYALALVVRTQGSTPQKAGAKALVDSEGNLRAGTIGGGLMERQALLRAAETIGERLPVVFDFAMQEEYSREAGPICGGTMRIYASPRTESAESAYESARRAYGNRERGVLLTHLSGAEMGRVEWVAEPAIREGRVTGDASVLADVLHGECPSVVSMRTASESNEEFFVEPIAPRPRLLIVGGGHVGQAVAVQAHWLEFDVTVVDDRAEFARPELFPAGVTSICGDIGAEVKRFPMERDTYVVLVSKGHRPDAEALEGCIHAEPAFVGMIGSKRKVALLREHFLAEGLATREEWDRIFAPIGLDIGAITVPEIATSIMAQVIAIRRQGRAARAGAVDKVLE